jgi:hypothetical protein
MYASIQNIKEKLCKTKADMWFNKMCEVHNVTPKYININVSKYCAQVGSVLLYHSYVTYCLMVHVYSLVTTVLLNSPLKGES